MTSEEFGARIEKLIIEAQAGGLTHDEIANEFKLILISLLEDEQE